MNGDGRMDIHEFSIAMKLIKLKLQGHPLPPTLPPTMKQPPLAMPPQTGFGMSLHVINSDGNLFLLFLNKTSFNRFNTITVLISKVVIQTSFSISSITLYMRSEVLLLFQVSLLLKKCIHSPGLPPMAPIAAPLPGVPPLPLPPLPVGVSPPLITSGPPPLPQPIANGTPPTGIMQTLPGFSHPGVVKAFGTFLRKSVCWHWALWKASAYMQYTHSYSAFWTRGCVFLCCVILGIISSDNKV